MSDLTERDKATAFDKEGHEHVAWEPVPELKDGTCGTCRYLDRTIAYPTYPAKYRCMKSEELHYIYDECNIPALSEEE